MNRRMINRLIFRDTLIGFLIGILVLSQDQIWEFSSIIQPIFILILVTATTFINSVTYWKTKSPVTDQSKQD